LQLRRVALQSEFQIGVGPFKPAQFFSDDSFGFGFGALTLDLSRVMLAELSIDPLQDRECNVVSVNSGA
jgi:hypothetical protein